MINYTLRKIRNTISSFAEINKQSNQMILIGGVSKYLEDLGE